MVLASHCVALTLTPTKLSPQFFLKRVTRSGFADGLFAAWRNDENFVLNQEPYRQGSVLIAGPDFGTGSSREHAVWALMDYGFRVVLSPRFADIFRGNAAKSGLVAGVVAQEDIEKLWEITEAHPGMTVTVSLEERTVTAGDYVVPFELDDYTRWRLMEGLDDIDLTLRHEDEIAQYEINRPSYKPITR